MKHIRRKFVPFGIEQPWDSPQQTQNDEAEKPQVTQEHQAVLNQRYDLSDRPITSVMMSGGRAC
jgi:cytochrome c peroxidase